MAKKHCICPIPFHQVFIQSSGKVYPCAFLQNHTQIGDVNESPLSEVLKSEEFKKFQRDHLSGEYSQCCKNQEIFACHKTLKGYQVPENPLENPIIRIDFMIDSHCNLRCIMCTNVLEERGGFEDDKFWLDFEENILPFLHEIELIGGEPLILPHTFKTIDLIKKVNPSCRVKLTTNGAYRLGKKVKKALEGLNIVNLGYSIDSLKDDIFATIRPGGELKQVLQTLEDFIEWRDYHHQSLPIEVNFVVQKLNAFEVPSFLSFVRKKKLQPYLIFLNHPDEHSLLTLKEQEKVSLLKFYIADQAERPPSEKDPELTKLILTLFKKLEKSSQAQFLELIIGLKAELTQN